MSELVERVAKAIAEACEPNWDGYHEMARAAIEASGINDLRRTATAFVEELKAFGYGQTSEKALPGSYDALVAALERIKE